MTHLVYKKFPFERLVSSLMKISGSTEYAWASYSESKSKKIIEYPGSAQYVEISLKGRNVINDYFLKYGNNLNDIYVQDYLKKTIDLEMLDYAAFRSSIADKAAKAIVFDDTLLRSIYDQREIKQKSVARYYVIGFCVVTLVFFKFLLLCLTTKNKVDPGEIIYIRKKPYHDLGFRDAIFKRLNDQYGCEGQGAYITFSRQREFLGNYFLNAFSGSERRIFDSYTHIIKSLFSISSANAKLGLDSQRYASLLSDLLTADYMMRLKAIIYFGVLVDKPFFVFLSKYKRSNQQVLGVNESFFYPPFRSFDYNHLDTYYCMNDIDKKMQNKFGGNIAQFCQIEFFRGNLHSASDGLSQELKGLVDQFGKMVVFAPIQVASRTNGYMAWSVDDVQNFVRYALQLAKSRPRHLFVLKGKKSELRSVSRRLLDEFDALDNTFLINSDRPRDLNNDQFEDLLTQAKMVISMSHTSTTIWQALGNRIPVVAINDSHSPSFLGDYPLLEIKSEEMELAFDYWTEKSSHELSVFFDEISGVVNLGDGNGLHQVADDIHRKLMSS